MCLYVVSVSVSSVKESVEAFSARFYSGFACCLLGGILGLRFPSSVTWCIVSVLFAVFEII